MVTRSEGPGSLWTLRIWARLRDEPFTVQMGDGVRRLHGVADMVYRGSMAGHQTGVVEVESY